ncbi:hypothetical protein [Nocardia crassostreae]|uniref:hypothetical protein n=1 Tax=Nocardia crassostreae TaxID=53428 RepID=UPI0008309E0F|nr:hypothetical protein [Nocardia crassostreae]
MGSHPKRLGRHPRRTPFYGVVMILAAMLTGLWVRDWPSPVLQVIAYIALFVIAAVGFVMTFRDYS